MALTIIADDGLPIDEVGAWAKEKHTRLRKYVGITSSTRRKWVQGCGCATYIDLFCGTGRAVIRGTGERINGSPLVAFEASRESGVPFSEIHIADISRESSEAADHRLRAIGATPNIHVGEATDTASEIVKSLNPRGLHFVFLDPYKLEPLSFSIIETFASLRYVDLLIHISVLDLQRNMKRYADAVGGPLDRFAPGWRTTVDLKQ
jgi:three-Cys-motif partner protein